MNTSQLSLSIGIVSLAILISSCSSTATSPTLVQGGSITGVVTLGQEMTGSSPQAFANSSGVTVTLDGAGLSTTTDSSGFWKFDNVRGGNYNVTITKAGFGLIRAYGETVEGPGTAYLPHITLGPLPSVAPHLVAATIATISIDHDTTHIHRQDLQIRWTTPLDRDFCGLCIYIDKDSSKQPADVHFYSSLNGAEPWDGWFTRGTADSLPHSNSNDGLLACPIDQLHAAGIASGSTIYITLAQYEPYSINGESPFDKPTYYDPVNNQNRLISPSPRSNVVAITVP